MTRASDPVAYAHRKDAFVDAAQHLIQTKGYERMSVDDVLGEVGVSKGAFYHYFDSKGALLEAVIGRLGDAAIAHVAPVVSDSKLSAIEKFEKFFGGIAAYEADRSDLVLAVTEAWVSDENAVVREHFRRRLVSVIEPILRAIVRQGVGEGAFAVTSPEMTARVLVSLWQGMGEDATDLFLALGSGTISPEFMDRRIATYLEAFERILCARPGSLKLPGASVVDWRRWQQEYQRDQG